MLRNPRARLPRWRKMRWGRCFGVLSLGIVLSSSCATIGPKTLVVDPAGAHAQTMPFVGTESHVRFHFTPLRTLAYDGFALPLVSPDGCNAAVQVSSAADWGTLLATIDGGLPDAGQIAIAPLCDGASAPLVPVAATDLLLGRSADGDGFLVESPRLDGSRWIGRIGWVGGEPIWLVEGEEVNACASLGPAGELAWCHRQRQVEHFSLSVRRGESVHDIPAPEGGSWYAPSFSADGEYLFALRLRDGVLAACAFLISQTISTTPVTTVELSWRADTRVAYQTLVPIRTGGSAIDPRLYFYHPRFGRMAAWDPRDNRIALASPGSAVALVISESRLLTTSPDGLAVEPLPTKRGATEAKRRTLVVESFWIPVGMGADSQFVVVAPKHGSLEFARLKIASSSE